MSDKSLSEWLDYQQQTHPQAIALGLERVRAVADRLALGRIAERVIVVGGTNGKGSTVAFIEAMARAGGLRVGCYTSPHLLRYNERVRIDGVDAEDTALVAAFDRIEAVRGDTALTFFEWGTLAALWLFSAARLDLAVLEVGLGGRLDAVNLIDADLAVITTVALDHMELLGDDRETIGREKAGILRAGRPAVLAEAAPPDSVLHVAQQLGAQLWRREREFTAMVDGDGWRYRDAAGELQLPAPGLLAPCQIDNAAAALAALRRLFELPAAALAAGVAAARVAGRLQRHPGPVELVLDVAHNPQSAAQLAQWLQRQPPSGRHLAVFAALRDKDVAALVAPLQTAFADWHLAGIDDAGPRSQSARQLAERLPVGLPVHCHGGVAEALEAARTAARAGDRIVVFGSFHTVGAALAALTATS